MSYLFFLAYVACVPLANWMVGHVGSTCIPGGPCLLPVAPGLTAPSGVLLVGLSLVLRDGVQERMGKRWALGAIAAGTGLSVLLAPAQLVLASGLTFAVAELLDFAVYTPLRRRGLLLAVAVSSFVGLVADSVMFLVLAFGSLDFLAGQVVGKTWMVLLSLAVLAAVHRRNP